MFKIQRSKVQPVARNTSDPWPNSAARSAAEHLIESQPNRYHRIGSGAFGVVYGSANTQLVYKTGDASCNKAYLSFVKELSKQKTHNPFLPEVYGCRIYESGPGDRHFVVAMERLSDRRPDGFYETITELAGLIDNSNSSMSSSKEAVRAALGIQVTIPEVLRQAVDLLHRAKHNANGSAGWDLHGGNFMMRDKQIVIIDPLA